MDLAAFAPLFRAMPLLIVRDLGRRAIVVLDKLNKDRATYFWRVAVIYGDT